jgi:hypothetical protein
MANPQSSAPSALQIKIKDKLHQILELTQNAKLSSTEHGVDAYIAMVEGRHTLIAELSVLKEQERETGTAGKGSTANLEYETQIQDILRRISESEEAIKPMIAGMIDDIKKGMKDVSTEKSINAIYGKDSYESGMMLNKTQ